MEAGAAAAEAPTASRQRPGFDDTALSLGERVRLACHHGLARKDMGKCAGTVPLILKINGKTNISSDADAFSALTASVEDAVSLGADTVGSTLYLGSPRQDEEIQQFSEVWEAVGPG